MLCTAIQKAHLQTYKKHSRGSSQSLADTVSSVPAIVAFNAFFADIVICLCVFNIKAQL